MNCLTNPNQGDTSLTMNTCNNHTLNPHANPFYPSSPSHKTLNHISHLKICFLNVCHLINKTHEIEHFLSLHKIDALFLAETFLTGVVSDAMLHIPGYTIFRRDRQAHGGGLAAYVRSSLKARISNGDDRSRLELLMLEIRGHHTKLLLGGVYRPPATPIQFWTDLSCAVDKVVSSSPSSKLMIVGDFNVDVSARQAPQLGHLKQFCDAFNISNRVNDITRIGPHGSKTTIDLILAHHDHVSCGEVIPSAISDHFPVICSIPFSLSLTPEVRCGRNLKRIDMRQFAADLMNSDLENFSTASSVDAMWQVWVEKILIVLDVHAPMRRYRPKLVSAKPVPWLTPEFHDMTQQRNAAHRRWRSTPTDMGLRDAFTTLRAEVKRLSRRLKSLHYNHILTLSASNSRKTWQTINLLSGRQRLSVLPSVNVSTLSDQFGRVVADPGRPSSLTLPSGPSNRVALSEFEQVDISEVMALLMHIDERKATGSDQIPARVLKNCATVLAPSLAILINASMTSGVVPSIMKLADVRPLFKSGDRELAKNYRPISLLPIVSKVLEKAVHKRLSRFLAANSLLPPNQFAYRPNHSTEDAVTLAVDRYLAAADNHLHTGVVFVDLSKAFDKVRHQHLINDLFNIGVTSSALTWFASYLTDRRQRVMLSTGEASAVSSCQCGVPQGSVLGPLLFSLYIKDVSHVTRPAHSQLFADDIAVDASSRSVNDLNTTLTTSVGRLHHYLTEKGLILNTDKTQVLGLSSRRSDPLTLTVSCNGDALKQTPTAKYLGLVMDSQLQWDTQVSSVVKKMGHKLAVFRSLRSCLSERQALLFFNALILPDLMYATNSYFSALTSQQRHQLQVMEKRCVRCIAQQPFPAHTGPIYTRLNIATFPERAECKLRLMMFRTFTGQISPLISRRLALTTPSNSRQSDARNYHIPIARSGYADRRPLLSAAKLWNSLPSDFKSSRNVRQFKQLLKAYFHG